MSGCLSHIPAHARIIRPFGVLFQNLWHDGIVDLWLGRMMCRIQQFFSYSKKRWQDNIAYTCKTSMQVCMHACMTCVLVYIHVCRRVSMYGIHTHLWMFRRYAYIDQTPSRLYLLIVCLIDYTQTNAVMHAINQSANVFVSIEYWFNPPS